LATQGIRSLISPEEADRAIYLDYEGNMGVPPVLLGWMVDGAIRGSIVDPMFVTCAARWKASHVGCSDHMTLLTALLEQAMQEKRLILSWSEHDYQIMCRTLPPHFTKTLSRHYRNVIPTARRWHWHVSGKGADHASLAYFMGLMGYVVPDRYGQGVVGQSLRRIRSQLDRGREFRDLTPAAREGWRQIVKHNMHDLQAMALVVATATKHLQSL
jgi:hypothetical protein